MITNDDLLQVLTDALTIRADDPRGAKTTRELCAELQLSQASVKSRLHILHRKNMLECVRVKRMSLSGLWMDVPAYRLRDGQ